MSLACVFSRAQTWSGLTISDRRGSHRQWPASVQHCWSARNECQGIKR